MRLLCARRVVGRAAAAAVCALAVLITTGCAPKKDGGRHRMMQNPTPPKPEFRGIFVTTAYNLDWPSKPSIHRRVQRDEIAAIVAQAKELNCNVIMLQVRAFGDRIHRDTTLAADSGGKYVDEPWAQSLAWGNDPDEPKQSYDPLKEWMDQCRDAGIELHAWVNPFRVNRLVKVTLKDENGQDKWYYLPVVKWEKQLWLRPDSQAVQDYVKAVVKDLFKNYPPAGPPGLPRARRAGDPARMLMAAATMSDYEGPDGIIYDHYAPPPPTPPTTQPSTRTPSQNPTRVRAAMLSSGSGITSAERRVDWLIDVYNNDPNRHLPNDTVNVPLEEFFKATFDLAKDADAKFGLSPNADDDVVEKVLLDKKVDYVIPEIYEPGPGPNAFENKLEDWLSLLPKPGEDDHPPIVAAGLNTVRVQTPKPAEDEPVSPQVILKQMDKVRAATGEKGQKATGEAHYSFSALRYAEQAGPGHALGEEGNLGRKLKKGHYKAPRVPPPHRRPVDDPPDKPNVWIETDGQNQRWAKWEEGVGNGRKPRTWRVWTRTGTDWSPPQSFGWNTTEMQIATTVTAVRVQAVDKYGRESAFGSAP